MKLNIVKHIDDARSGYLNVCDRVPFPLPEEFMEWAKVDSLDDISPFCEVGQAEEIVALGVVEYIPLSDIDKTIDHWCDLLAVGGTITLGSLDIFETASSLATGHMTQQEANLLIHGHQTEPWQHKCANYGVRQLAEALAGRGLSVTRKSLNRVWAVVQAERK